MNRKLRVLMLSLFAVMFAVSSAFAFSANDLTITLNDDSKTAASFAEYEGTVTVENTADDFNGYTITWSVSGDWTLEADGPNPDSGATSAIATLTGTAPYTESDKTYTFTITATFTPTAGTGTIVKSQDVTITVTAFDATNYKADTFSNDNYITYSPKNINEVGTDYSVTMTFATETVDEETVYPVTFLSDDAVLTVVLPEWLQYKVVSVADVAEEDYTITKLNIFYSSDAEPADGTVGHVRILGGTFAGSAAEKADYQDKLPIISWDVTFVAAEEILSFDVVKASADVTIVAGSSADVTFTLKSGDAYCTSLDIASSDVSTDVKGFTFTISSDYNASGDKFAVVTIEVSPDVVAGKYSFDVVLYSTQGVSADATLYVKVLSADFTVSYDVSTDVLALSAGESTDIYIPVFGAVEPLTLTGLPDGYVATFVEMSGDYAVFKIFVPEGVEAGSYSADVTITDAYGRSQKFTLAWTVGANVLTISEDKTVAVSVAYGSSADVTFTYYGAEVANAIWSSDIEFTDYVSLDVAWSGISGDTGTITVTVIPLVAVADSYNTAIYFYDANSNDVSIDLTVNVTVPAISLNVAALGLSARVGSTDQDTITHSNAEPVSMKMSPDVPAAYGFKMTSSDELNTFTLSITPTALVSPDYRGRFVVTDEYGNVASASVTLHTVASADAFTITPDDSTVTLMAGSSTLVSLVASNNSGLVTWSYGKTSADITVSSSDNAGATQDNVRGTFRVAAAITASGDYRVPFTARDAAGHSKTATITVKVTGLSKTVQDLINSGYVVVENGRLVLTNAAFQSGSAPTAALVGNFYEYILMLNFNVTSWRLYLNDTRVAISAADGVSAAAGEEATITPDADDPKVALGSINRTTLTEGTSYNVELGVIPEGGTEEIRGSLGKITGGTSMVGVGSASGGCDAGLGMLVSALAAAFFIGRKRS